MARYSRQIILEFTNMTASRRMVSIEFGPGNKMSEIVDKTFASLQKKIDDLSKKNNKLDADWINQKISDLLAIKKQRAIQITMWPKSNGMSIIAVQPTDLQTQWGNTMVTKDSIMPAYDMVVASFCDSMLEVLRKDMLRIGLINWDAKKQRQRLKYRETDPIVALSKATAAQLDYDEETKEIFQKGEQYYTGNVSAEFNKDIFYKDLSKWLREKGYSVSNVRGDEEDNEDDEDEINEQKKHEIEDDEREKAPPLLKIKKSIVVKNVDKLSSSLDEFVKVYKDYPDYDLSDLTTVFSSLVNKLNDLGIINLV